MAGVRPPLPLPLPGGLNGTASTAGAAAAAAAAAAALAAAVGVDAAGAALEGVAALLAAFLDASFAGLAPALGAAPAPVGAGCLLKRTPMAGECSGRVLGLVELLKAHTLGRALTSCCGRCEVQ